MLPPVSLCANTTWNVKIDQGSTFQREWNFGDIDMAGLSLRGAIARRPGSAILCPYTFTPLSAYALGVNIAVNGGFDADTNWTKGAGVTIANGVARFTSVATGVGLTAAVAPLTAGNWYSVTLEVGNYASGGLELILGTTRVPIPVTGDGAYTIAGVANATGLTVRAVGVASLTLNNLTLRPITPYRVLVTLLATQTAALPSGTWWHDVEAYAANGWVMRLFAGTAEVSPEVTR